MKSWRFFLLVITLSSALYGCSSTETPASSKMPWARPAGWDKNQPFPMMSPRTRDSITRDKFPSIQFRFPDDDSGKKEDKKSARRVPSWGKVKDWENRPFQKDIILEFREGQFVPVEK